jgi:FemAB-related protein (PEP-CTERM system-associated)
MELTMEISELKREEENEWDEYVRKSKNSTFYHQIGWKRVISDTYHHRPFYLVAKQDDRIFGILPSFRIKYPFFGEVSVSLPFASYGGICADDEDTSIQMIEYLKKMNVQNNIKSSEIRSLNHLGKAGLADKSYFSMVLALQNNIEVQWSGLRRSMRRYVKKAQSSKLETNINSHNIKGFFELYSRTMRDFGTPAHSDQFFKNIFREFPDTTRIAEVNLNGECIAAILLLEYNGTIIYGWGASDERFSSLHPNYLLFWEAISDGCSRGFLSFDFGRSMIDEGTFLFKTGWGAEPRQLYYHYYPQRTLNTKKNNPKRRVFATIWSHLPVSIASSIGPILRRYTP